LPHNGISVEPDNNNELQKPYVEETKHTHKQVRRTHQCRVQTEVVTARNLQV